MCEKKNKIPRNKPKKKKKKKKFIHEKNVLTTHGAPGTVPGTWDTSVNQTEILAFIELTF